jgi:AraC family cel operon transcriptional repressor
MKTCHYKEDFAFPESKFHFHLYNTDYAELHDHDYWEFFIVLSGEIDHYMEERKQPLTSGIGCLVHPRDKHRFANCSKNYRQMNICITDEHFKELVDFVDDSLYGLIYSINHPIFYELDNSTMREIYKNIHAAQTTNNKDLVKFSNFLKLIWLDIIKIIYRQASSLNSNYPEWLNSFLQSLQRPENLVKPISELHELTYFSYRHLTRLFKELTGETLCGHVQTQRMNYGAMLLRTTDMGILPISSACGYDSLSHFIKTFKLHFKMTPKEYRRSFAYTPHIDGDK